MKYQSIQNSLFIKNRIKLKEKIDPGSTVVLHSTDLKVRNGDQYFSFRQDSDLFYLTGIDQENVILVMCPDHPKPVLREVLFIMQTSEKIRIYEGNKLSKEDATNISGIQNVKWIDEFESILKSIVFASNNIYINLPENPKFKPQNLYPAERFVKEVKKKFPAHKVMRMASIMRDLRVVKEEEEIKLLKQACRITQKAFHRILNYVHPGLFEYEIEAEMTHEFIRNRATGHAYDPIVASGKNAIILHYVDNNQECKDGDLLLIDFGAEYANYAADCTRTIPVNGKFSKRQKECYEAVLRVQEMAIELLKPGKTLDQVNADVNMMMVDEHIKLGLYSKKDLSKQDPEKPLFKKFYPHGTCHFIGLDVHDVGDVSVPLQKGMVLTCEPAIYIEDEGIGIRIEDNIVVDDNPINLMKDIPKEIEEIEKMMKNK